MVRPNQILHLIRSHPITNGPTLRMCFKVQKLREKKLSSLFREVVAMSREQEEDLTDKACSYLLEGRYPDGCSSNAKRVILRKAGTLVIRGEKVFYKKVRKHSDGKKVFQQRYCCTI